MKRVIRIEMPVKWGRNRNGEYNPHCNAVVYFDDRTSETTKKYRCGGCGYDKLSTIFSDIYNDYLADDRKQYFDKNPDEKSIPYGMFEGYFDGGIGDDAYGSISKALGGELHRTYSDKSFDLYVFTKNTNNNKKE